MASSSLIPRPMKRARHWRAHLSAVQVRNIRKRYAEGKTQKWLAAQYKVSQTSISNLLRGHTYRSVT